MSQYTEVPKVGFGEAVKLFFSNYTNFSGRSRRSEFWWAILFNNLISILLTFILPEIGGIWTLVILIPSLSLAIRRLHDTGHNGWYYLCFLIPLIGGLFLLVWYCTDSTEDNQWGPNPKKPAGADPSPVYALPKQEPAAAPAYNSQPAPKVYGPTTIVQPTPPPAPAPKPAPAPQKYVTLYLGSGPMAGKSYRHPVGSTVTLGRSTQRCNIALNQYNVVSGVHCQIRVFDQYVTVMDMGSTNGTFVNGARLTPNQPVAARNGSTICLANSNCAFQVRF